MDRNHATAQIKLANASFFITFKIIYVLKSMITAYDENKKLINLFEVNPDELKGQYFCPACRSRVLLRNGKIKVPHFAHQSLQDCQSWSENESQQHLSLKIELYEWFSKTEKCQIEHYLAELEQTPDLLVNDKIAVEIQCSRLSISRLKERTENYQKHGYTVIWLMGKDLWLKENISNLQKQLTYFSWNSGFYYWELDVTKGKIRLKSLIHQDIRGKIISVTEEFDFGKGDLLEILRRPFAKQKMKIIKKPKERGIEDYIQQQLFHKNPKWMKLQEKYYKKGENLLTAKIKGQSFISPLGLNLLDQANFSSFIQMNEKGNQLIKNYYDNFAKANYNTLYPPVFYDKMRDKKTEETSDGKRKKSD